MQYGKFRQSTVRIALQVLANLREEKVEMSTNSLHPENDPVTIAPSASGTATSTADGPEKRMLFLVGEDCDVLESEGIRLDRTNVWFFSRERLNGTLGVHCFEQRSEAEQKALEKAKQVLDFMEKRRKRILTNIALFNNP